MPTMTSVARRTVAPPEIGPDANGLLMTPEEFDEAEFEEGYRYELINGVLIVSPATSPGERSPNEWLGYLLWRYHDEHPKGYHLDDTLPEHDIKARLNRRRGDRAIWCGLGRQPRVTETPTIIAEFVSKGRRNYVRDYEDKRDEYEQIGVIEYWVIDRFRRNMTVFKFGRAKVRPRVVREKQVYTTPLLPGFKLPLAQLLERADRWPD